MMTKLTRQYGFARALCVLRGTPGSTLITIVRGKLFKRTFNLARKNALFLHSNNV